MVESCRDDKSLLQSSTGYRLPNLGLKLQAIQDEPSARSQQQLIIQYNEERFYSTILDPFSILPNICPAAGSGQQDSIAGNIE
ncbi:hypothetical protein LJC57_07125 [Parabacteroides sp. OttesenSCG-928-G07]|nr:hypothetical protein [Parabacteroides sp. OttesenSCG-928-G07]